MSDGKETTQVTRQAENISLGFKLEDNNYPIWSRLMKVSIGSKGKLKHITHDPAPPKRGEAGFAQWEMDDLTVFAWILNNMETKLVSSFAQHSTSKAIWDSLAITYGTTSDPLQTYDLEVKANKITQGERTIEAYWAELQGIWLNIDQREPNPFNCCEKGIRLYQEILSQRRLFQFLSGLDPKVDGIRRDILKDQPLPAPEAAFSRVRREIARRQIMEPQPTRPELQIGAGFAAREPNRKIPPSKAKIDRSKLVCTHCGMKKHTRDQCFQIVGFPEWWDENRRTASKGNVAINSDGVRHAQPTATETGMAAAARRTPATANNTSAAVARHTAANGCGGWLAAESFEEGGMAAAARSFAPATMIQNSAAAARHTTAKGCGEWLAADSIEEGGYQDEEDHWAWH